MSYLHEFINVGDEPRRYEKKVNRGGVRKMFVVEVKKNVAAGFMPDEEEKKL